MSEHNVLRQGTLSKLGGKQKDKWQHRDVELSITDGLVWATGWGLRQQLLPAQIVSVSHYEDAENAFEVESHAEWKAGKVYKFKAESDLECQVWMQEIQRCIDVYNAFQAFGSRA